VIVWVGRIYSSELWLGLLAVAVNYTMALAVMAILGLGVGGDLVVAGTAFSEFCPLSQHWALALLSTTWNIGSSFGVGLAWVLTATKVDFIHMWRLYCLIMAGMVGICWATRLPMDESPEFLVMKGRRK